MPMTLEEVVAEARLWPKEKVGELLDRLTDEFHAADSANEQAWKKEARRRLSEIESGAVKTIDGAEVSARIGRLVGR